jgi:hypothetical protein
VKTDSLRMSAVIPADPKAVYAAWMSSKGHAAMTGSGAKIDIPAGHGPEYRKGWLDFYFKPMKEYFASL